MNTWLAEPLGELCQINPKLSASDAPSAHTLVSFVPMAAVDEQDGAIGDRQSRQYAEVAKGYTSFRNGDVLFAKITPCMQNGKSAIASELTNGLGFGSTEFHVIRANGRTSPKWVFYFVRQPSFRKAAEQAFTGSAGQQRVPADFMARTLIPVAPLEEQERIVKLLDEADGLRKLRAEAGRRTADLIPALFHDMFGVRTFPSVRLGELTSLVTSGVTPRGGEEVYVLNGPYFIRSQNIRMNRLDVSDAACLPIQVHDRMSRTKVSVGDVLLNITGASIGRVACVDALDREANVSQHVCLIRPLPDRLKGIYLSSYLSLPSVQSFILNVQAGASRQALNHQQVRALEIPVPPLSFQEEFTARVTDIRAMEAVQGQSKRRLDDLFQSMLHSAFAGEL